MPHLEALIPAAALFVGVLLGIYLTRAFNAAWDRCSRKVRW